MLGWRAFEVQNSRGVETDGGAGKASVRLALGDLFV